MRIVWLAAAALCCACMKQNTMDPIPTDTDSESGSETDTAATVDTNTATVTGNHQGNSTEDTTVDTGLGTGSDNDSETGSCTAQGSDSCENLKVDTEMDSPLGTESSNEFGAEIGTEGSETFADTDSSVATDSGRDTSSDTDSDTLLGTEKGCDGCQIGTMCVNDSELNVEDSCRICDVTSSAVDWTKREPVDCCNANVAQICDTDGNVHWVDSCGNKGAVASDCLPVSSNGDCFDAKCGCAEGWSGDNCNLPVFFVNATIGSDDDHSGRSWSDAFSDLQKAFAAASVEGNGEIWVAQGRYVPGDTRNATFQLAANVGVYGGFSGTEHFRDARDVEANETILDGDIAGNDIPNSFTMHTENVYHVVTGAERAVLDGFTIRGGYGEGGLFTSDSSMEVRQCLFRENYSDVSGGAVRCTTSTLFFANCQFIGNSATEGGGAIYMMACNNSIISGCIFESNTARHGAGIHNWGSDYEINNSLFIYNEASLEGGAFSNTVFLGGSNDFTVRKSTFVGNISGEGLPALDAYAGNLGIVNSIIWGNFNSAGDSIQLDNVSYANVSIASSILQSGCIFSGDVTCGLGVSLSDPAFVDPTSGNFQLSSASPAIDAGKNASVANDVLDLNNNGDTDEDIPFDLAGNPRSLDGDANASIVVDMGAYEYLP